MKKALARIRENAPLRSVGVLMGGTAFAQLIAIVALPILTRIYSPEDFGVLATFAALLATISVASCLRFDAAIPIPEDEREALVLLLLAFVVNLIVSVLLALGIWLLISVAYVEPGLSAVLWLLPFCVMAAGMYSLFSYWAIRSKEFETVARCRVAQSFCGIGLQVGAGWFSGGALGLALGHAIYTSGGFIFLARQGAAKALSVSRSLTGAELRGVLSRYSAFPKYSTSESLFNIAAIQVPIVMIAAYAGEAQAGLLMVAMRAMQAPLMLLGGAVAQVYLSGAPEKFRSGQLAEYTLDVLAKLLKFGVGPVIFIGFIAEPAFYVIIGPEWDGAGMIALWMVPWLIFQFLASPISMSMHVAGKANLALGFHASGFALRAGLVLVCLHAELNMVIGYAISGFLFYLAYLVLVLRVVSCKLQPLLMVIASSGRPILIWALCGLVVRVLIMHWIQ